MLIRTVNWAIAAVFFSLSLANSVSAEASAHKDKETVTASIEQKQVVLSSLQEALANAYVDEKIAGEMSAYLAALKKHKAVTKQQNVEQFAQWITKELQAISNDQHLRIEYSPEPLAIKVTDEIVNDFEDDFERSMWQSNNFGFNKLERLPFNLGYMKLEAFAPKQEAAPMLASAFTFLNNSSSLIIDLRGNFGGFEYTGVLFASYFLEEKTHLFDMHWRQLDRVEQRWSYPDVEGPKYGNDKQVYILIDQHTFSAAEAFAYNMKHLGLATLVGEKTAGAANAGDYVQLSPHFKAFVPMRRLVNVVTNDNFEGKGVIPDVEAASAQALKAAQIHYLTKLKATESNPRRSKRIEKRLGDLQPVAD